MKPLTEQQIIRLAKEFFQCEEGLEVGDVVVTDDLIKNFASELLALQREKEDYGGIHNLKPAKNWDEDKDQENGNYMNKCIYCKSFFMGHKRRVVCKECSKEEPTKEHLPLYQCPYSKATKCNLADPCLGCETRAETMKID